METQQEVSATENAFIVSVRIVTIESFNRVLANPFLHLCNIALNRNVENRTSVGSHMITMSREYFIY